MQIDVVEHCQKLGIILENPLTKTKYIKLNTKTQNMFCHLNENFYDFFIHFNSGDKKTKGKVYTKVEVLLKKNWVLVFSFMYLVLVDAMD